MEITYTLFKAKIDTDDLRKVYEKTWTTITEEELKEHLSIRINVARKLEYTIRYTEQDGKTTLIFEHYFHDHIYEREIYQYPTFKE